ncbi:MAG: hypothetical protein HY661_09700 [Betaproteobacteria bacterium]|nr:hypothetical protein [Betaproteobacteria bacterium]
MLGITAQGAARAQAVEMYRYWRRLTTPLGEQVNYSQAELKYLAGVLLPSLNPLTVFGGASSLIAAAVADRGLGVLPPDAQVVVTGHSLGGHLAQLFYEMFPQSVEHVYTYNAAGFGGAAFELAERLLRLIGRTADVPVSGITNIVAEHGFSLTAGFGRFLGETKQVFNEKSLLPWENHFIDKLTDSLALYDVLAKIDPQVSLASITSILDAGSNVAALSLRSVLGKLVDVFRLQGTGFDLSSPGTDRQSYFASLLSLGALLDLPSSSASLTIRSLADLDAQTLLGLARAPEAGIAYRYALSELNPFALLGADYSAFDRIEELRLYDSVSDSGAMTDRWLTDRAGYLAAVNFRNSRDLSDSIVQARGPIDYAMIDADGNQVPLHIAGAAGSEAATKIVFGSGANDLVQGNTGGDHLYGADGGDTLEGREGNDYLEGGPGADQLAGGPGNDTLAGGESNDVLTGGPGNDALEGGSGSDVYRYSAGDGDDTIRDSDGLGAIVYDGVTLTGGERGAGGLYWDATHTIRYAFAGDPAQRGTLQINDSIAIRDFENGDLGITLATVEAPPAPDVPTDLRYLEGPALRAEDGSFSEVDAYGSALNDLYVGTADYRSQFYGKAGDDVIVSSANDSDEPAYLTGGSGDDRITNSVSGIDFSARSASDIPVLAGGPGRDWIEGSSDPEALFGDLHRVFSYRSSRITLDLDALRVSGTSEPELTGTWLGLSGIIDAEYAYQSLEEAVEQYLGVTSGSDLSDYYDDYIDAGAGADYLVGGAGADVLIGGEGDDTLVADVVAYTYVPNYVASWTGLTDLMPLFGAPGEDYLEGGPGNDYLVGHDGDYLDGGPGADILIDRGLSGAFGPVDEASEEGPTGQIVMIGGEGDDQIEAEAHSVYVDGGEGYDTIVVRASPGSFALVMAGEGDDDILIESEAAEVDGGPGNDVYRISTASTVTISDQDANAGNFDRIEISDVDWPGVTGFSSRAMLIGRDGLDLVIEADPAQMFDEVLESGQSLFSLTISNWFAGDEYKIEQIQFGSGEIDFELEEMEAEEFGVEQSDIAQSIFDPAAIEAEMAARALAAASAPQTLQTGTEGGAIVGAGGNDSLSGAEGEDTLVGGAGNDTLSGGLGKDVLEGGTGDDTYRFDVGDGCDTIDDTATPEAPNSLVFGPGITPASVTLQPGSLLVGPPENGDEIEFSSFDPDAPEGAYPIGNFEFDDGTVLTYTDLLARGFHINGSSADDVVGGTALADRIDGGAGNDLLLGGDGSDTYVFMPGWGDDTLIDWGGDGDTLSFGSGISPEDVRVSSAEGRLVLAFGDDSVAIDWLPEEGLAVERVQFANGDEWDQAAIEGRAAEAAPQPAANDPDPADSSSNDSSPASQEATSQDAGQADAAGGTQAADGADAQTDQSGDEMPAVTDGTDSGSTPPQETSGASESVPQDASTEETDSQAAVPSNADSQNSANDASSESVPQDGSTEETDSQAAVPSSADSQNSANDGSSAAEESGAVTDAPSDSTPGASSESGNAVQSEADNAPESPSTPVSGTNISGESAADTTVPEAEQPLAGDEQSDDGATPVSGEAQASDSDANTSGTQTQPGDTEAEESDTQAPAGGESGTVSGVQTGTMPDASSDPGNTAQSEASDVPESPGASVSGAPASDEFAADTAVPGADLRTEQRAADGQSDAGTAPIASDVQPSDSEASAGGTPAQTSNGEGQLSDTQAPAGESNARSGDSGEPAASDGTAQGGPASAANETSAPVAQTAVGNGDTDAGPSGVDDSAQEASAGAATDAQVEAGAEAAANGDATGAVSTDEGQDRGADSETNAGFASVPENAPTAEGSAVADASVIHDPKTAANAEIVAAGDPEEHSGALRNVQIAGGGHILQPPQYRSSIDHDPEQSEAAKRELQRQIDVFFAHITPAPLPTQSWLDEWLPAGARPISGERTSTGESNEMMTDAYSSEESAEATGVQEGSGDSADSAVSADLAARYADLHAWLDAHGGFEGDEFSGIAWAQGQGAFALRASAWLGADQPLGMTLPGATPGMAASLNPNFAGLEGLREGFSLLRAG